MTRKSQIIVIYVLMCLVFLGSILYCGYVERDAWGAVGWLASTFWFSSFVVFTVKFD